MEHETHPIQIVETGTVTAHPRGLRWHYVTECQVELRDADNRLVSYAYRRGKTGYWHGQVLGRRDREPPVATLNEMQAHLEQEAGVT